ncbi:MAG: hypothetical protein WBB82_03615 [Limnothrix sp.]
MPFSQYVYFFGIVLHSFLFALTLGHLSRWFPAFGNAVGIIAGVVVAIAFGFCLMVRKAEVTALCFFAGFVIALAGGMAWL